MRSLEQWRTDCRFQIYLLSVSKRGNRRKCIKATFKKRYKFVFPQLKEGIGL